MTDTTHTPGPLDWLPSSVSGPPLIIEVSTQRVVAELNDDPNMDDYARLFAVAPELLQIAKESVPIMEGLSELASELGRLSNGSEDARIASGCVTEVNSFVKRLEAVIAKAGGQTND